MAAFTESLITGRPYCGWAPRSPCVPQVIMDLWDWFLTLSKRERVAAIAIEDQVWARM